MRALSSSLLWSRQTAAELKLEVLCLIWEAWPGEEGVISWLTSLTYSGRMMSWLEEETGISPKAKHPEAAKAEREKCRKLYFSVVPCLLCGGRSKHHNTHPLTWESACFNWGGVGCVGGGWPGNAPAAPTSLISSSHPLAPLLIHVWHNMLFKICGLTIPPCIGVQVQLSFQLWTMSC